MVSTTLPKLEQFLSDSQLHTTLLVSDPHHCTSVNTCTTMARNQDVTIFGRKNTMETSGGATRLSASGSESLSMEGANLLRYVCVYLAVGGGSSVKTESLANGPCVAWLSINFLNLAGLESHAAVYCAPLFF